MVEIMTPRAPNDEKQLWDSLVCELDKELMLFGPIRHEMGRILHQMKVHLKKHGLDTGRAGRWKPLLKARGIAVNTANDWVRQYEEREGIPAPARFFTPPKPRAKKRTETVLLPDSDASIEASGEPDKVGREAVEAVFVLTYQEKLAFLAAVKKLGAGRATQLMYQALVAEGDGAKGVGA
jgi:hypothetical protein